MKFFKRLLRRLVVHSSFCHKYPLAAALPYPILVDDIPADAPGGHYERGTEVFDGPACEDLNEARLKHLDSLGLSFDNKVVLDLGCGIGALSGFFIERGASVVCVDARRENIVELKRKHPEIAAHVCDVETDDLKELGLFDIVLCYGLLYHLENPILALRNIRSACNGVLLLETQICDAYVPVARLEDECMAFNQATRGLGHRLSPSYVVMALSRVGFPNIYVPARDPMHEDFGFRWEYDFHWRRDGHNLRSIFLAADHPMGLASVVRVWPQGENGNLCEVGSVHTTSVDPVAPGSVMGCATTSESSSHCVASMTMDSILPSLRRKWTNVPTTRIGRQDTKSLLSLSDDELLSLWQRCRDDVTQGGQFAHRGWYHELYSEWMRGKAVMDVGSGFAVDSITFALAGARITFVDIVEDNLRVVERLCSLKGLEEAQFVYLENLDSLKSLDDDYDAIMAMGSLHHAPISVIQSEVQELLGHLKEGGRWLQLAYPKTRWIRNGKMPFDKWGEWTDGAGTPWAEWYDLEKLLKVMSPHKFDVVLSQEFHNSDFIWFDLLHRGT